MRQRLGESGLSPILSEPQSSVQTAQVGPPRPRFGPLLFLVVDSLQGEQSPLPPARCGGNTPNRLRPHLARDEARNRVLPVPVAPSRCGAHTAGWPRRGQKARCRGEAVNRSPQCHSTRSASPQHWPLAFATSNAAADTSAATTSAAAASWASDRATAPEPQHRSRIRPPAGKSSKATSTSTSVSGRGINTAGVTVNSR